MTIYRFMLPLIPEPSAAVKDLLSAELPFSDRSFRPDTERFLKIGQGKEVKTSAGWAVKFRAAEFLRNANGEYHYTGQTIRAVTFDLSEAIPGKTTAWMTLYDLHGSPFARAILLRIRYDFPTLSANIDELCGDLERLSGQPAAPEVERATAAALEGVKPETRRRAELAIEEKEKKSSISYQGVATRLMGRREAARSKGEDLGIGDKEPISGDDINYAIGKMRKLEPENPKWTWSKGDPTYHR